MNEYSSRINYSKAACLPEKSRGDSIEGPGCRARL